MNRRVESAFSLVELIVVIAVIGVLSGIGIYSFGQIQVTAATRALQSDLRNTNTGMQLALINDGTFPDEIPEEVRESDGTNLTVTDATSKIRYDNLSPVQNGVLLASICAELIAEGAGQGVNQGGDTEDYLTGCGNWNDDGMQITGWQSRNYSTPLAKNTLTNYADNFTVNGEWNKAAQEGAVKYFYGELVDRFEDRGGEFPITSFWDYWANESNGGVMFQPLPTDVRETPYYCVEAAHDRFDLIWHTTSDQQILEGPCPA